MRLNIFLFLVLFFLTSCGDSPFIEDEEVPPQVLGRNFLSQQLSFSNGQQLSPFWALGPLVASESKISFLILDKESRPINQKLDIRVKLWMPNMGHGSFPVKITYHGLGLYQATDVFFTMRGYWDIYFQQYDKGVLVEEIKWPLEL